MSRQVEVVKVFIASPGDLAEERKLFPQIVNQLNNIKAQAMNYMFQAVGWEDALPGFGRPQAIINEDVQQCDVFVLLLWKRWGTPSGEFSAGTEEEFSIAHDRYRHSRSPHLLLYFRSVSDDMMADPGKQLQKVIDFRSRIERERLGLYKVYDQPTQWGDLLRDHLSKWLDTKLYGPKYAAKEEENVVRLPSGSKQRMRELQMSLRKKDSQLKTAQSKLHTEAVGYALNAMKLIEKGNLTEAEATFAKSIELFEEPEVVNSFGRFLFQIGSLDRAEDMFKKLLQPAAKKSYQQGVAYINLGNIYETRGELKKAEEMYTSALKVHCALGRKDGIASAYRNLGSIYRTKGNLRKAEEVYRKAVRLDLRNKVGLAKVYGQLGILYLTRGDLKKAKEMHEKALKINRSLGNKEGTANANANLANVFLKKGALAKARRMYEKALAINKLLGRREAIAKLYGNLGVVYKRDHDLNRAEQMYKKSLNMSKSLGAVEGMVTAYTNLGIIYREKGKLKTAQQVLERALNINESRGLREGLAGSYDNLADVYIAQGEFDKGKAMLQALVDLYKEFGNKKQMKATQSRIDSLKPDSPRS